MRDAWSLIQKMVGFNHIWMADQFHIWLCPQLPGLRMYGSWDRDAWIPNEGSLGQSYAEILEPSFIGRNPYRTGSQGS